MTSFDDAVAALLAKKQGMRMPDVVEFLRDTAAWMESAHADLQTIYEPPQLLPGHYLIPFPAHPALNIEVFEARGSQLFSGIWCRGVDISDFMAEAIVTEAEEHLASLNQSNS